MSPYQRPGWPLANGHVVRSKMEAAVCEYLLAAKEPHAHGSLLFELTLRDKRSVIFRPRISLTQTEIDGRVILLEPVLSPYPGGGIRRLMAFREVNAEHYFVIVLARRPLHPQIPHEAYDQLFPSEDLAPLDQFLVSTAGPS